MLSALSIVKHALTTGPSHYKTSPLLDNQFWPSGSLEYRKFINVQRLDSVRINASGLIGVHNDSINIHVHIQVIQVQTTLLR